MSWRGSVTAVFYFHALARFRRCSSNRTPSHAHDTVTEIEIQLQVFKILRTNGLWVEIIEPGPIEVELKVVCSRKGNVCRASYMLPCGLNRPLLEVDIPGRRLVSM